MKAFALEYYTTVFDGGGYTALVILAESKEEALKKLGAEERVFADYPDSSYLWFPDEVRRQHGLEYESEVVPLDPDGDWSYHLNELPILS